MEIFLKPKNINRLVDWILNKSTSGYILVFEYYEEDFENFIKNHSAETNLPQHATYNYDANYKMKAFRNMKSLVSEQIEYIIKKSNVLSLFKNNVLQCLIADDYDLNCISCSKDFYETYYNEFY